MIMDKKKQEKLIYSVFIILTVVFFMYVLFPSDIVKRYIVQKINEVNPDVEVTIGAVKPVFPSGLRFNKVTVYYKTDSVFYAEKVKATPGYFSIFVLKPAVKIKALAYEGVLKGKVTFAKGKSGRKLSLDADLNNIRLNEITVRENKISATIDGEISYSGEKGDDAVASELSLTDCSIELVSLPFPITIDALEKLDFKKIEIKAAADLRKLEVEQCELTGEQVNGSIKGSVKIRKPMERSSLKFTGKVSPHPQFLAELKKSLPFDLMGSMIGDEGLSFKIGGSVGDPKFSMN